jgi:hypothetical protein
MQPPPAKGPFFIFLLMMPAFLFLIVLMLVAMQYKQLRSLVAPRPLELATVPESPEAQEKVRAKLHGFLEGAPAAPAPAPGAGADTLALSGEEINHLARTSHTLADMHLDYHLDFEDTLLVARNSLPVEHLKGFMARMASLLRVKGYLNSEMKGYPEFKDGTLSLVPVSAVMNGQAAPVSVLDSKGKFDLRNWVSDRDFYDQAIARLAEVKIRGGKLILVKKR